MDLLERVRRLKAEGIPLGGREWLFVEGGRKQLVALLHLGLTPHSKVLDIGCGVLRAGYWLIHFLEPGKYFGIEPRAAMLDGAARLILEPGQAEAKRPSFDQNETLDFTVFNTKFDFFLARSIWTHAPKHAIERMLDGFLANSEPGAIFLTSFLPPQKHDDYSGTVWVPGLSHNGEAERRANTSGESLMVRHDLRWIVGACAARGLAVRAIKGPAFDFGGQHWIAIGSEERLCQAGLQKKKQSVRSLVRSVLDAVTSG